MQDLILDRGARLVHIGPHKTGTTTIQGAFHQARDRLADEHGVVYPLRGRQPVRAAIAVTGATEPLGESPARLFHWNRLVRHVTAAGDDRVVVSSEFFADGDDEAARRVVRELGGPRVHVVVTLRPLVKVMPSQWQQYVQSGTRTSYEEWLNYMFNRPPYDKPTPSFWRRHRHDRLVERWAEAVGTENLTVVVADESDPMMLVRAFESMLDLPSGVLVPEQERTNRSLTRGEVEVVRVLNEEFRRRDWPDELYARFLRNGAVMQMKAAHTPSPGEAKVTTPRWAVERAAQTGAEMAEAIEKSGVRIVGDLATLGAAPDEGHDAHDAHETPGVGSGQEWSLSSASAAQALLGAISASGVLDYPPPPPPAQARATAPLIHETDAKGLVRVLFGRGKRRARRTMRRLTRR